MIYLTTGGNGAGKTLITLHDVREQQLKENRPVYYHGFDMHEEKAQEFGWQKFDPKKWQDLPDGSICIMDECQNEFPIRRSGSEVPDYVNAIAQHRRRRGFDFWMISPHPSLIDIFIRRLIDRPSWHRHMKRASSADIVSELKFSVPDMKCEEQGAGARAEITMRPYPKDVYTWYRSASLHTAKKKIPKQVYIFVACVLAVPLAIWFAVSAVTGNVEKNDPIAEQKEIALSGQMRSYSAPPGPITTAEYLASYRPRLEAFPHTAPRYDEITRPTSAPYPAACVVMEKTGCKCYSQQATLLQVPDSVCLQIVNKGFFMDWSNSEPGTKKPPMS